MDPCWGSFYKRLIDSFKKQIKQFFTGALIDFEKLNTVLTEAEGVNSRPLTYIGKEEYGIFDTEPHELWKK